MSICLKLPCVIAVAVLAVTFALMRPASAKTALVLQKGSASVKSLNLTGMVLDASNQPMAGATIYVYTAQPRAGVSPFCPSCYLDCGKQDTSSAQGLFHITALSPTLIFRLLVIRDGYEPTFIPNVDPQHGPIHVTLKPRKSSDPNRLFIGRVLDPAGLPVVGATVEPIGLTWPDGGIYGEVPGLDPLAITDGHGDFRFDNPHSGSSLIVLVKARGLAPRTAADLKAGVSEPQDIPMVAGVTVSGIVQDEHGFGIRSVTVQVVPTDREEERFTGWQEIGTDAQGRFSLPNVPPGTQYDVCVRMDSLARAGLGAKRQTITVGSDRTTFGGMEFVARPAAHVSGQVILADGTPIRPGTRIMLNRDRTWDQQQVILSSDGRFAFQGAPVAEDLTLYLRVRGYHVSPDTVGYDKVDKDVRIRPANASPYSNIKIMFAPDGISKKP